MVLNKDAFLHLRDLTSFSLSFYMLPSRIAIKVFTFKRTLIFNLRCFNAKTKVSDIIIRDLLIADDCALVAHTIEDIQFIMDCFSNAAQRFGLTVHLKKSQVLYQPKPGSSYTPPVVKVYDILLTSVDKFSYLGSTLSQNIVVDNDISMRLSRAGAALAT